ncbi:MAG: GNAT family N-acetyltransferase [Clostridia bacterium]|nr:GNAT family N-acetyltransferase [Clostridia bacterium]
MHLRELREEDAPLMLEWMHDENVVHDLNTNFSEKTLEDCLSFIAASRLSGDSIHLAIASDEDEYMGTVSLKHIRRQEKDAEFAITVRRGAMGRGYSWYGMEMILERAFEQEGLDTVYWCVSRKNARAVRFYDKHHFHEMVDPDHLILARYEGVNDLKWYAVLKHDTMDDRKEVAGCRIVRVKTVRAQNAGELSFFEAQRDVPFEIKRIYYISKVPEGVRRGFHAHKELKQLLFCPYGTIQLLLENETGREEIVLSDPSVGVVIDRPTWREMLWLRKDSVLCVAASDYYEPDDYIRDYDEFHQYLEERK